MAYTIHIKYYDKEYKEEKGEIEIHQIIIDIQVHVQYNKEKNWDKI